MEVEHHLEKENVAGSCHIGEGLLASETSVENDEAEEMEGVAGTALMGGGEGS